MIAKLFAFIRPGIFPVALIAAVLGGHWMLLQKIEASAAARTEAQQQADELSRLNAALIESINRAESAALAFERMRAEYDNEARTITREVVREVEKPVYRECAVPADGVRLLNQARAAASRDPDGTGEPAGEVPTP